MGGLALSTVACNESNASSPITSRGGETSKTYVYGNDEYFDARVKMYEEAGLVKPGKLTKDHLPWDPNGPTVKVSELHALLLKAANGKRLPDMFIETVRTMCDGGDVPQTWGATMEYSKADYVDIGIGLLRLGGTYGGVLTDASGGIDCENGSVEGGTGELIYSYYDHDNSQKLALIGVPLNTVTSPLAPPVAK